MSNILESLLFLPNWTNELDGATLSDLLSSIGHNENIVIVIVSISEDDEPILYEHARISKTITDRQIVKDLLIKYQVIQLPSSVMITKIVNNGINNDKYESTINNETMNSISKIHNDSECPEEDKIRFLNRTKVHTMSPKLESIDDMEMKSTDIFAEAVKAYENFDLSLAANRFDKAIMKDPSYKSALFNLAGLLHMIDYPILSIHYIERVLLLDKEDMIAHSFLWALIQPLEMATIGIVSISY
jgi:hypothetical protein